MTTKEQRVTKVLQDFLQSQGYTDVVAKYSKINDSFYAPGAEYGEVVLGGITNKEADEVFMSYCKELGLITEVSVETLSFLHELGHHNTMDFLDDDELTESELIKLMLYMDAEESEESYRQYFNCPIEREATLDAIDFCNHCAAAAKELDRKLLKALYE